MSPHLLRLREQSNNLFRSRAGCDVEVFGRAAEQQIAHAAARETGLMPRIPQSRRDLPRRPQSRTIAKPKNHASSLVDPPASRSS